MGVQFFPYDTQSGQQHRKVIQPNQTVYAHGGWMAEDYCMQFMYRYKGQTRYPIQIPPYPSSILNPESPPYSPSSVPEEALDAEEQLHPAEENSWKNHMQSFSFHPRVVNTHIDHKDVLCVVFTLILLMLIRDSETFSMAHGKKSVMVSLTAP